jgi:hypothetical protein
VVIISDAVYDSVPLRDEERQEAVLANQWVARLYAAGGAEVTGRSVVDLSGLEPKCDVQPRRKQWH